MTILHADTSTVSVSIDQSAHEQRAKLLAGAVQVTEVVDVIGQEVAVAMLRDLKAHIAATEEARVKVKAPILSAGKKVDQIAKDHVQPLEGHALRLGKLLAEFQMAERERVAIESQARLKAIKECADDEKWNEIVRAPLPEVAKEPGLSLRNKLDFVIEDIGALYKARPELVRLEPNRAEILRLCSIHSNIPGIRFFEEKKISLRG